MTRSAALMFCLTLTACMTGQPPPETVGQVTVGADHFPIEATAQGWQVRAADGPVLCRAATEQDCYWSSRAHLAALDSLDDPG